MKRQGTRILSLLLALVMVLGMVPAMAAEGGKSGGDWLTQAGGANDFPLVAGGKAATLWVDAAEAQPVKRVVDDFKADIKRVTGAEATVSSEAEVVGPVVIIGTLGTSAKIQALVTSGAITSAEVESIKDKWEAYLIKVVDANTLVVVGSDPRGAVFGTYEISEKMGVSPWYYFADVPAQTKENVYLTAGTVLTDKPDVQYRGIFLNDEEKLSRWVTDVFNKAEGGSGTMGAKIYGKIFELILRLKGNYVWAAMHVNSINNIPANIEAVHEYGIVLGSSHCDMLLRTNTHEWANWKAAYDKKNGTDVKYDYTVNPDVVLQYWRENVVRHKATEAQWTLGMRGAHDEPFNTANIDDQKWKDKYGDGVEDRKAGVLSEVIAAQQEILSEELGQEKYDKAFMAFIPYKEVLPLYNNPNFTMTDDVTVIWCDDNHGMVRRTPSAAEQQREGGSGLYYHVSYWAPADQSYLWMSSLPLSVMGEELNKSWETGIQKSWVLNIGDIKPNEGEMEYFIRCGWDVDKYTGASEAFSADWMARNFGSAMDDATTKEVADILNSFYQHTNVRKVDHMRLDIFEQTNYNEWDKRMAAYQDLYDRAGAVAAKLNSAQRIAFYELVQCKINWAYLTNKMFYYADKSTLAYDQGRMASADAFSQLSMETELERKDEIAEYSQILNGKWKGFIDPENHSPPVTSQLPGTNPALVLGEAAMGVAVQGEALPQQSSKLTFSPYNQDGKFIDIFNQGAGSFNWTASASESWVKLSAASGTVNDEARLWVAIEDMESQKGKTATITVTGGGVTKTVTVTVESPTAALSAIAGYVEADGYVSMQAEHYTKKNDAGSKTWQTLSNAGRGFDGDMMRTFDPALHAVDENSINAANSPSLEYDFTLTSSGAFPLEVYRLPTMNATAGGKVRFAVSVDNGTPMVVSSAAVDEGTTSSQNPQWRENLYRQIEKHVLKLPELTAGKHTLKLWMVDNLIAIDKMVIYTTAADAAIPPSALGPDESYHSEYNKTFTASVSTMARSSAPAEPKDLRTLWGTGAFQEEGGKVAIEAEYAMENELSAKAQITDDMSAYTVSKWDEAAKFPGGGKLSNRWRLTQSDTGLGMRLPDVGTSWTEGGEFPVYSPELTYKVNFKTTGTYHVWVRWRLVDNSGDSIRAGLNNSYAGNFSGDQMWKYENDEKWHWREVGTVNVGTAGAQPFSMWMREDGLYLDRIYLTTGAENPGNSEWQESIRGGVTEADAFKRALEAKKKEIGGYSYPIGDSVGCYSKTAYNDMMSAIKNAEALASSGTVTEAQGNAAIKVIDDAWKALADSQKLTDGSVTYHAYRNFENDTEGALPYGFAVEAMTNSTAVVMEENGNKFLRTTTGSESARASLFLPYQGVVNSDASHRVIIEYRSRFTDSGKSIYANGAMIRNDSGAGNYSMVVAYDNNNGTRDKRELQIQTGGSKKKVLKYTDGTWYDVKLVCDWSTKTYSVYIDGQLMGYDDKGATVTTFNFRHNGGTQMTGHYFGPDDKANSILDMDDFRASVVEATTITPITGTVIIQGTAKWGQTLTADVTALSGAGDSLSYVWKDSEGKQVGTGKTYIVTKADVGKTITVTVTGTGAYIGSVPSAPTGAVADADNTHGAALKEFVDAERAKLNVSIPLGSGLGCYGYAEYTALTDALDTAEALSARAPTEAAKNAAVDEVTAAWTGLIDSLNLSEGDITYNVYRDFSGDQAGSFPYGFTAENVSNTGAAKIVEEGGNKFLRLTTGAGAGGNKNGMAKLNLPYAAIAEPQAGERVIIEFRTRFDKGQYANACMPRDQANNYAMAVFFQNASSAHKVLVQDGPSTNDKKTVADFNYQAWHSFKLIGNFASNPQTYTVFMDGEIIAKDFKFRSSSASTALKSQDFGIDGKNDVQVDFDDFSVYVANPTDILSVAPVENKRVPQGTAATAVGLPETVAVTMGDGSTQDLAVSWSCANYDGNTIGDYPFTGALTLVGGITNSKLLTATAKVSVSKLLVACVGDSITFGSQSAGPLDDADKYPAQLQALLGETYEVRNFGVSGATMVADGSDKDGAVKGYYKLSAYTDSIKYAPDVVVIMLGTNDSKGLNWDNYKNDYVQDALDMIKSYQDLNSNPKVYVATSPTVLSGANDYGIQGNVVHNEIVYLQRQIALAANAGFIDVHEATKDATEAQFPDKVHGNKEGYAIIANTVKTAITAAETPKAAPIQTVDDAQAGTVAGFTPELPFTAVTYEGGAKGVASVDWDLTGKTFDTAGTVAIDGALTGLGDKTTTLAVTVAEAKLATAVSATATSREAGNPESGAIDNNPATRWAADGNSTPQDLVIQLDGVYELDQITIVWYNSEDGKRRYQYDVEVSTDGVNYTKVVDRSANGRSGTVTDPLGGVEAQYVKIHATGRSGGSVSIWEVDLFGKKPGSEPTEYTVTVNNGTSNGSKFEAGDEVTVTATVPEGKQFAEWTSADVELTAQQKTASPMTFIMPAKNVTISATVQDVPTLADLSGEVTLIPADGKVTLKAMAEEEGATYYYKSTETSDAENKPTYGDEFLNEPVVWTALTSDAEILGTNDTELFVQVIKVTDAGIMAWGEAGETPVTVPDGSFYLRVKGGEGSGYHAEGEEVTVTATIPQGKIFVAWIADGIELTEEQVTAESITFTMPANEVILTATVENETIPVTGVTLDQNSSMIYTNTTPGSVLLVATVAPAGASNKTVEWTSSDPAIARVDANGLVTAMSSGTAIITATTEEGGFTAECMVTVVVYYPPYVPDNTTTTTEKNEDGSTTKTVTNKTTGTVTETTTYPNGDKAVVETKKDGTVTEKVTKKDGYQSETVTKSDGSFTSKVTDADGVKTETTATAKGEITADVKLPEKVESAKVTVPIKEAAPGTVAVIVREDGTEEIIRTSVTDENGVSFMVTENAKIKLVDNTKTFNDVAENHWAANAVVFATSRELFLGAGESTFAPETSMSRAMLFTVLARLDGKATQGGESWYSKAMDWAVETGISNGADPEGSITREQLATMLYRYAGMPKADGGAKSFTDSDSISAWAADAMDWAVQEGVLKGSGNQLSPNALATRAEVAAMLQRFISR